jgi:hypothetical protein
MSESARSQAGWANVVCSQTDFMESSGILREND